MDIFETAIMRYIAIDRSTLVIPQYDIDSGWASLDFLGINTKKKIIYIVEVTSAEDTKRLRKKIEQAFEPEMHVERLKQQLHKDYGSTYDDWPVRAAVFVRRANRDEFKGRLSPTVRPQVDVFSIEECVFPWEYWDHIVGEDRSWDRPCSRGEQ